MNDEKRLSGGKEEEKKSVKKKDEKDVNDLMVHETSLSLLRLKSL